MSEERTNNPQLSLVRPLIQEERQFARSAAQQAVLRDIGERPRRDQYLCLNLPIMWVAAALSGAFRCYFLATFTRL